MRKTEVSLVRVYTEQADQLSHGMSQHVRSSLGLFFAFYRPCRASCQGGHIVHLPRRRAWGSWPRVFSFEPSTKPTADTAGSILDQQDPASGFSAPFTSRPCFLNSNLAEMLKKSISPRGYFMGSSISYLKTE